MLHAGFGGTRVDRAGQPVLRSDAQTKSNIHIILQQLWLCVVKPILDALAYAVNFMWIPLVKYNLIYHRFVAEPIESKSDLVVRHWPSCIHSSSCCWDL